MHELPGDGPLVARLERWRNSILVPTDRSSVRYLVRWGLLPPALVDHMIRFVTEPTSRTYVVNYPAGRDLCRSYVAGDPDRFRVLLTEQVRVRDLLRSRGLAGR